MNKYVFFIGGSGARVYKALIHCAAAGVLKAEELSVLLIDADEKNHANKSSIELYREYEKIYKMLDGKTSGMFNCKIEMASENVLSPVSSDAVNLELAVGNANKDRKRILRCLYTKEEIEQQLDGGFYAHPNIGCVFFADFNNKEFDKCLTEMESQLNNGKEVRVALVGSVFGGTGAAGLPTIYKLINSRFESNNNYNNLHVGGILLEPYFKVNSKQDESNHNIPIEMDDFYFNTYEALSYYKTNSDMKFESIYLVGQQNLDIVSNEYADSGDRQNNKEHMVELYAALAIDRFFNCPEETGVFGSVRKKSLNWSSLPGISEDASAIGRLADFVRLQTICVSEIYGYVDSVEGTYKEKYGIMVQPWYNTYKLKEAEVKAQMKVIEKYSVLFLDWLYKINSVYNAEGQLALDNEMELFGGVLDKVHELVVELEKQNEPNGKDPKGKDPKYIIEQIRNGFNELVGTISNVEYVAEKVMPIMSMLGYASTKATGVGLVGLLCKLASLVCEHK